MNVLFVSLEANKESKRDNITYNFIVKEMVALQEKGVNVFFLSFLGRSGEVQGIPVISAKSLMGEIAILRRISILWLLLRNINFINNFSLKNLREIIWQFYCEKAIILCVQKYKIDIIHTHFFSPDGGSATIAKKYCHIPVIATCRGAEICNMPEFNYGAMRNKLYRAAVTKAIPLIDAVTVPNKYYKKQLIETFPNIDISRVEVLYNGVEQIAVKKDNKVVGKETTFIVIGNFIPLKNHKLIFEAVDLLSERFCFKVIIVGDGILKENMQELVRKNYKQNILLHPEVPKNKLFKMIASADCLLHPSFSEGGSNVTIESLAIGTPCIVSDIPSMQKEIIKDGVNGFLFDPFDPTALAERMDYVIQHREDMIRMAPACRASVEPYSLDRKIEGYLNLYQDLAEPKSEGYG